jgi:GrpB-like predicted nucleotidyltransferase (UPF0157 family)
MQTTLVIVWFLPFVYVMLFESMIRKQERRRTAMAEPLSEEQIQAVHIEPVEPHNATVHLADYDPSWPQLFEREARRICAALGDRVLLLEHVGSTSVPGLAAKPKIDILLAVENSADEAAYVPDMEAAGYVLHIREPEWHEHRLFKGPDTVINLHVFSFESARSEIERMLLFRDWLRSNEADRQLYERAKRKLAARKWKYVQNYADAKTEVVEEIMQRAARGGK